MAPECFEGKADARSEVFALGVVLYELLTGKRPFDRESATATMVAIQLDDRRHRRRVRPIARSPSASTRSSRVRSRRSRPQRFPTCPRSSTRAARRAHVTRASGGPWIAAAGGGARRGERHHRTLLIARLRRSPLEIEIGASRRLTFDAGLRGVSAPASRRQARRLRRHDRRRLRDPRSRDLDGGDHRRLTTTPGWDYASAISPDGTRIAYVHEDADDAHAARDLDRRRHSRATSARSTAIRRGAATARCSSVTRTVRSCAASSTARDTMLGTLPAGARLYHLVEVADAGVALMWWTSSDADATALGELDRGRHAARDRADPRSTTKVASPHRAHAAATTRRARPRPKATSSCSARGAAASRSSSVAASRRAPASTSRATASGSCSRRASSASTSRASPATSRERRLEGQVAGHEPARRRRQARARHLRSHRHACRAGCSISTAASAARGHAARCARRDAVARRHAGRLRGIGGRGGLAIVDARGGAPRTLTTDPSDTSPVVHARWRSTSCSSARCAGRDAVSTSCPPRAARRAQLVAGAAAGRLADRRHDRVRHRLPMPPARVA